MATYTQITLLNFVLKLSPGDGVNPYSQTEEHLQEMLLPPPMPSWSRSIQRAIIAIYVLIFLQSFFLLGWRIKTNKFLFIGLNAMGLIKFDCMSLGAIVGTIYSSVTITDLVWKETIMDGYHDQSWQLILFGCKFIAVLTGSWCFLWVCMGHWLLQKARDSHRELNKFIPPAVAWLMNGAFIVLTIAPIAPILWKFFRINSEYLAIKTALAPIMNNLLRSAINYSPNTYSQALLIAQLLPAEAALPHLDNIEEYLRFPIVCYLSSVVILCVAYLPFIYLLVIDSRKLRIMAEVEKEEETKSYFDDEAERIRYLNNKIRQQHDAVLQHVVMTYLSTVVFVPVLIWLFIGSFQAAYTVKPHWWNIALIGLHGPYAVVTAISMFLLQKTTSSV